MITIELFGKFCIRVNGKDATRVLGNSKKGRRMLEYLILHKDETMTSSELYELLWPDEEIANPESALKTLVSRTRSALSRFDASLAKCIVTTRGAYRWNTDFPCEVDVFVFESLCLTLLQATTLDAETEKQLDRTLALYKGELSAMSDSDSWIISRNTYYSSLCVKTALHAIRLMQEKDDLTGLVRVARRGLEVDPLDETMHVELMRALVKLNRGNEALRHYDRAKAMHFNEYGLKLPESIQNFYKQIIQGDQFGDCDIETIRLSLQRVDQESRGAFLCEYAVFKDIYLSLVRSLATLGESGYLATVLIAPADKRIGDHFKQLEKAMDCLLAVLSKTLRPVDVYSRYSSSQIILLLPSITNEMGQALLEETRQAFAKVFADRSLKLTAKLVRAVDEKFLGKSASV